MNRSIRKTAVCLLLLVCLGCTLFAVPALAAEAGSFPQEMLLASSLKGLGLFQGVSDTDFALDRVPTRAEALVMLLRLLGQEDAAKTCRAAHPFADLSDCSWAEPYIAYAYKTGLTKGTSATEFGGNQPADAAMYLTFVLRALGYTEGEGGDFRWNAPTALAQSIGLTKKTVPGAAFLRANVVAVSYAALGVKCKGEERTLAQRLTEQGVLSEAALRRYYDPTERFSGEVGENIREILRPYRAAQGISLEGLSIKNYSTVFLMGDAAYEKYGFYQGGIDRCTDQINAAADAVGDSARVFGIIVPNRLGALLTDVDFHRLSASSRTETEAIDYAYSRLSDSVIAVNAATELRLHNDEEIFFRSDHHWTGLGAYYAYTAWAKAAGFEAVPLSEYETLEMPGYLGMFYGLCGNPMALKQNPDTVISYTPDSNITVEVQETNGSVHPGQLTYDYRSNAYAYGCFIGGDHPLTTITNHDIDDDSACVLVKDSYGNPFSVYLTQHYHTVYVIDYRYYKSVWNYLTFSRFAEEKGVDDFIILLPMTLSQSDATAGYLKNYCK